MGRSSAAQAPKWGLTKYAALKLAAERGCVVSQRQFATYLKWGLIPDPEEGQWTEGIVDRLVEIRGAEGSARRLERRAIRLGVQNPEKRRLAMIALSKIVKAPRLKVRRLQRAAARDEESLPPTDVFGNPTYWRVPRPKSWRFPEPSSWPKVLNDKMTRERFDWISHSAFYSAQALVPHLNEVSKVASEMPYEEVILLLTIQELSLQQQMLREAKRDQSPK